MSLSAGPFTVAEVMTAAPAVLHVTQSIRAAQRILADNPYQHIPVIQGGKLIGILSDRDIAAFLAGRPHAADLEVALAMTADPVSVAPETPAETAAELLIRHRVHSLPVVDGDMGKLLGIVTPTDLMRLLIRIISPASQSGEIAQGSA